MSLRPRPEMAPKIRKSITLFEVCAFITGIMLFGLYIVSGIRWGMNADIWLATNDGFLQLVQVPPEGTEMSFSPGGFNFTTVFLIVHGWFYVVYLITTFTLWSNMRWPFWIFLVIALAGCVIIVSFIVEVWAVRKARAELAEIEAEASPGEPAVSAPAAS